MVAPQCPSQLALLTRYRMDMHFLLLDLVPVATDAITPVLQRAFASPTNGSTTLTADEEAKLAADDQPGGYNNPEWQLYGAAVRGCGAWWDALPSRWR